MWFILISIFIEQINIYIYTKYQKAKDKESTLKPRSFIMVNKVGHGTVQGRQNKIIRKTTPREKQMGIKNNLTSRNNKYSGR